MIIDSRENKLFLNNLEDPFVRTIVKAEHEKMSRLLEKEGSLDYWEFNIEKISERFSNSLFESNSLNFEAISIEFAVNGGEKQYIKGEDMVKIARKYLPEIPKDIDDNDDLSMIRKFAPSLTEVAKIIMKDSKSRWYVTTASPQPQAVVYDTEEEPSFMLDFSGDLPGINSDQELLFRVKKDIVEVLDRVSMPDEDYFYENYIMTHVDFLKYIDQMPIPFNYYAEFVE